MRINAVKISAYDRWVLFSSVLLMAFGLLMVASASMVVSDRQYGYPFYYVLHQLVFLLAGLALLWAVMHIPMDVWKRYSGYLLLISLFFLLLVLIPGIGRVVNGSRRWFHLGFISLQVSEGIKLTAILYLSGYLVRYADEVKQRFKGFLKPMVLLGVIAVLLLLEPDFGAFAVITATFLALLFIADVPLWPFSLLFASVAVAMGALAITSPYRLQRLTTFLNPWHHQFGSGYQLTQSLIAFGRGGFFGVGLGNSVQKLFYLPEAHTDFLFAVLAEEFGLLGECVVIGLFVLLIASIFRVACRAREQQHFFSSYTAFGIGLWMGLQVLINIGVNVGVLPTKGLTLPLMSYGGSSMLINCIALGIVFRVAYETADKTKNSPRCARVVR